ncbi:MAG: chemotaxis-specific protein-glutamate methyltransferase CheB [Archangiaceae bacterium]|nr:chemotaxis-specific protein-glutamate methyltransferase CheB [Archangiaceae bacterium]
MLTDILSRDPEVEVLGAAPNATVALRRLRETPPDVVTLDVEMPDVTGLELLTLIHAEAPKLPVIMFSALTQRAASTTLDALARGASDYVTKPSGAGSREAAEEHIREQLIPKIKTLGRQRPTLLAARPPAPPRPRATTSAEPFELVAVGASTGGPNALSTVFGRLPHGLLVPFVLVQHMPPLFTRLLAERLSATGPVPVREAQHGELLVPGEMLIAPGDFHLRVVRDGLKLRAELSQEPQENSCRPAVDVLFRSVAKACGPRALGVVLTGMGQDGLKGCEALRAAGSPVVVQDEASSVVWGMPGAVARAGLADAVRPLDELAAEMSTRIAARMVRPGNSRPEVIDARH